GAGLRHRLPLDAGWKAGTATAAQARRRKVGQDRIRRQRQRTLEPLVAAMGAVVVEGTRIDDAASREGEAGLAFQPGNLVCDAKPQRVRPMTGHRLEQG